MKSPVSHVAWAWNLGQIAQGVMTGALLVAAVVGLLALSGDVAAFRYQGF
jgi:hypothetical protein